MKLLKPILAVSLMSTASIYAKDHGMKMMTNYHSQTKNHSNLLKDIKHTDGFKIEVSSIKPLTVGNNNIVVNITKDKKPIDAKIKIKFFMPAMPGMPAMSYDTKGITKNGKYRTNINLSMGGTWQYIIKFKKDDKVYKTKGSVNLWGG